MSYDLQKELYYRYATPESKELVRDAFKWVAKINFKRPHPPLLFLSGSKDRIIPASLNYCNYEIYPSKASITNYKEFKGRNHLIFGHPAWIKEAEFVLCWLQDLEIIFGHY